MIHKLRLKAKWEWTDFKVKFNFPVKMGKRNGAIQVLVFHGICKDEDEYINGRFIKETTFRNLLKAISENFHVISMSDFLNSKLKVDKLNVLLTFDDGYHNNKELALPICQEFEAPFTIFMCNRPFLWPDYYDILLKSEPKKIQEIQRAFKEGLSFSTNGFKNWLITQGNDVLKIINYCLSEAMTDELKRENSVFHRLLSDQDCEEMSNSSLVSFANHGGNHLNSIFLGDDELSEELSIVDDRFKKTDYYFPNLFAYPYGKYSEASKSFLLKKKIVQFTADGRQNNSNGVVDRLVINPYISITNQLVAIVNGKY